MALATSDSIKIIVEFSGGLEILFDNVTKHEISVPIKTKDEKPTTVGYLVEYIVDHLMKDRRKELFVQDGSIRPGILVLINDADWELEGEDKYEMKGGDNILFVSTLHGG